MLLSFLQYEQRKLINFYTDFNINPIHKEQLKNLLILFTHKESFSYYS